MCYLRNIVNRAADVCCCVRFVNSSDSRVRTGFCYLLVIEHKLYIVMSKDMLVVVVVVVVYFNSFLRNNCLVF